MLLLLHKLLAIDHRPLLACHMPSSSGTYLSAMSAMGEGDAEGGALLIVPTVAHFQLDNLAQTVCVCSAFAPQSQLGGGGGEVVSCQDQ